MGRYLYRAKRVVRSPLIWAGRRRFADVSPHEREALERHAYRKRARALWISTAMDPDVLYRAELDRDSVIVDVGAFQGEIAERLHGLYGGEVHAFEPAAPFFDRMARRFDGVDALHCYPYGLGRGDATLTMALDGPASSVHERTDEPDVGEVIEVEIRDVATVLDGIGLDHVDYMKINIEGGEFDLIDRLHESGWLPRTRYLLIQFHEWFEGAEQKRWKARRQLRKTHEKLWDYPWIYELWCAKDALPAQKPLTRKERAAIAEAMRAEAAAKDAGAVSAGRSG